MYDTDVLIWVFRGNPRAAKTVDADATRCVSLVTYLELIQGARDRQKVRQIRRFLGEQGFLTLPLTEAIGHRAAVYVEECALRAGMRLADALIAATAIEQRIVLCTGNHRHYRPIQDLDISVFRP
ncbi:MAG: type II toxin-antitoxin system VapC family toxin [Planctomycetes bacterium]|nr:type II toxin-antitoxin system VapC family toxin [Planctomycetota bacterium]